MPAPRIRKDDQVLLEQFGFVVEAPPEKETTRRSKYDDLWDAARKFTMANPGQTIKVLEYTSASNAYNNAKSINNGEHRSFPDSEKFVAIANKIPGAASKEETKYGLWLTYNGEPVRDA